MRVSNLATALVLVALPAIAACNRTAAEQASQSEWAVVERRDMDVRAEAAGLIEPIRVVEVKSKASGEVLRLHVETGDEVERGALLAEVDPRDVRNSYEQADADLAVAEARLTTSIAQKARVQELRRSQVATEQEYETAALDEANSRAQKVKAETSLMLAREQLEDVTIRAPIPGTIIARTVEEGTIIASASQNVSGGTVLMMMADLAEMQVRALVDETDIGRLEPGQPAIVTVDAYRDRRFEGRILKIEPQAVVDQNVTMFPVLVRLDNAERLLKPGMNAEVVFEVAQRSDVVAVPNAAIINPGDAVAAGAVLGINEDAVNSALRGSMRLASAPVDAPDDTASEDPELEPEDGGSEDGEASVAENGDASPADECATLVQGARGGGGFQSLSEADRAKLRECFPQMGGGRRGGGGGRQGAAFRGPGGGELGDFGDFGDFAGRPRRNTGEAEVRPAVVFVATAAGLEARRIMVGLNDFDYSEVINGLEPGERVVLMSVARLQAQQQEFTNRMRERTSGPLGTPASGGAGRGGR